MVSNSAAPALHSASWESILLSVSVQPTRVGFQDLYEGIDEKLRDLGFLPRSRKTDEEDAPHEVRIALVGRPNVGKSSILNRLAGEDRALVSNVAGTTRDTQDIEVRYKGTVYTVIDTAGIRRRSRIQEKSNH